MEVCRNAGDVAVQGCIGTNMILFPSLHTSTLAHHPAHPCNCIPRYPHNSMPSPSHTYTSPCPLTLHLHLKSPHWHLEQGRKGWNIFTVYELTCNKKYLDPCRYTKYKPAEWQGCPHRHCSNLCASALCPSPFSKQLRRLIPTTLSELLGMAANEFFTSLLQVFQTLAYICGVLSEFFCLVHHDNC